MSVLHALQGGWCYGISVTVCPAGAGQEKRPIVEFALENTQALHKMAAKQAWQKTQQPGDVSLVLLFVLPFVITFITLA